MRRSHLIWAAIAILACIGGWHWGAKRQTVQLATPLERAADSVMPIVSSQHPMLAHQAHGGEPRSEFNIYLQAYQEAASMSEEALRAKLTELSSHQDLHYRNGLSKIYFSRLVSLNGAGAFELVLQLYSEQRQALPILAAVAHEWMLMAPQELLRRIDAIADKYLQTRLLISLLEDPASGSLVDSQQLLTRLPPQYRRSLELKIQPDEEPEHIFERFLSGDFSAVERESGLMTALLQWSESDPSAALDKVLTSLPEAKHRKFATLILRRWATHSPMLALQRATAMERGNGSLITTVLQGMAERDGRAAMQQYLNYQERLQPGAVQELLSSWAMHDLSDALAYVEQEGHWIDEQHLMTLAIQYAEQQPYAALQWVSDRQLPVSIQQNVAKRIVITAPSQAESILEQTTNQIIRDSLIEDIAKIKLDSGFEQASTWLRANVPVEQFNKKQKSLLRQLAYSDPATAAEYVMQSTEPDGRLISRIAEFWTASDISAARGWVISLPPGELKDQAIGGYLSSLTSGQLTEAPALLQQVSNQKYRQRLQARINKG